MKNLFVAIAVIAILYFLVVFIYNKTTSRKLWNNVLLLIVGIAAIVVSTCVAIIPAQTCGVVITPTGVLKKSYETGWHFILPWYKVELMDKTSQVYTCAKSSTVADESVAKKYKASATQSGTIWAPTSDGIKMGFDISASWSIDPTYAWWIFDNVSEQDGTSDGRFFWLEENVIKAKLKSALALTVSKYTPIETYSNKRQMIQDEVLEKMKADIGTYHLTLNQIDIREVYYNEDYEKAINAKKLEEQRVLTLVEITKQKREQLTQAEIDKDIAIQLAEGEAKALQIKGDALSKNPGIKDLQWIEKWDGKLPVTSLGTQGVMINLSH
jgi:regulator of protease activity HflC (stomatin/prohibitin superfamily)